VEKILFELDKFWHSTNFIDKFYEQPFARIYYLKDGSIGKFMIVNWYEKLSHYTAFGKLINNKLTLHRIETQDDAGKKIIIFDRKS